MKGIIYKISFDDKIYIGSTIQTLKKRLYHHRAFTKYGFIKEKSIVEIIEERDVVDKNELHKYEGIHIRKNNCVNKSHAYGLNSTSERDKIRYKYDKEKIIKRSAEYYYKNHELNKQKKMEKYRYVCSWGGDPRRNNNLLLINL